MAEDTLQEKNLILQIRDGDKEAFGLLYNVYADYALRTAAAVTGSPAVAGDAVQETFIRVYRKIGEFEIDKPFKPWFYRILINECNRLLKNRARTLYISDHLENSADIACDDRHDFLDYEELYEAIQGLPDSNRLPIVLKYLNGFSEKEVAEVLELNVNTIKSRLLRGRQQLKEALEEAWRRGVNHG